MLDNKIKAAGAFTQRLWDECQPIFKRLVTHPFSQGLADASLCVESFRHYLSHDLYYLDKDAQAFQILAHRAENSDERGFLLRMAHDTLALERELNQSLMHEYQIQKAQTPSSVIGAYTSYLIDTAKSAEYCVALAALLPCFWLYSEVGINIYTKTVANNPFQAWIDCYNNPEFITEIERFIGIVEVQAQGQTQEVREQMLDAFVEACRYELAFFTEAIQQA